MKAETPAPIMLVGCEPEDLQAWEMACPEAERLQLVRAGSGEEALARLRERKFACVLFKPDLPDMDAIDLLARIGNRRSSGHPVPVLLVCRQRPGEEFVKHAYAAGAADLLIEPCPGEVLRAKVLLFLELFRAHAALEQRQGELEARTRELAERERWLRTVTDTVPAVISFVDSNLIYRFNNRLYGEWFDPENSGIIGRSIPEILGEEAFEARRGSLEAVLRGERVHLDTFIDVRGLGRREMAVDYVPHYDAVGEVDGFAVLGYDVTEQRREESRRRLLLAANDLLAHRLEDIKKTLGEVARLAVPDLGSWCAFYTLEMDGRISRLAMAHPDPESALLVDSIEEKFPRSRGQEAGIAQVCRTGVPILLEEVSDAFLASVARNEEHLAMLREISLLSFMCVPLRVRGRIIGALALGTTKDSNSVYGAEDLRFAEELATRAAMALENARLLEAARQGEAMARESREQMRLVSDSLPGLVAYVDRDLVYQFANKRYLEWFDLPPQKVVGKTVLEVLGKESFALIRSELQKVFSGQSCAISRTMPYKRGKARDVEIHCVPHYRAEGSSEVVGMVALVMDVSDRRRLEKELVYSAERYKSLVEATAQIVWRTGPTGEIEDMPQWREVTGQTVEEVRGYGWLNAIHPEDRARVEQTWLQSYQSLMTYHTEYRIRARSGEWRWLLVRGVPVLDNDTGALREWVGLAYDVTEHREAEQRAVQERERLRLVAKATNDVIWDWDLVTNEIEWNESLGAVFGYEGCSRTSAAWWKHAIHPEDQADVMEGVYRAIEGTQQAWSEEYRFRKKDGSYAHVYDRGYVLRDRDGHPVRIIGSMLDLTERRRAEVALRESEARFRNLANSAPVLIWISDVTGACTWFNRPWLEFTGRTLEEELGSGWAQGIHPEDQTRCLDTYNSSLGAREPFRMEYRLRHQDGSWRWLLDHGTPLFADDGEFVGFIGGCVDITDRHEAEERLEALNLELEKARDAALEASRAKSQFLANMSHELRTPLNAILGYAELLREEAEESVTLRPDRILADLRRINASGRHLLAVISDILDISRIEAGKLQLAEEQFDAGEIMEDSGAVVVPQAEANGNGLLIDAASGRGVTLLGDATRVRQILINLIGNAAKFTTRGEIRLTCSVEPRGPGEEDNACVTPPGFGWITFRVTDTGMGIAPEDVPKLFEKFGQLDNTPTRRHGGAGLGLAISRMLARLMGGDIAVHSELGRGSTFSVHLPIVKSAVTGAVKQEAAGTK